jgi:mRNA interferase MazF
VDRLRRGDLVIVALPGDLGKPRPALILQSDLFLATHPSVTVLPITSEIRDAPLFRIVVEPSRSNGLRKISQIMVDKPMTFRRDKIGAPIGRLDDDLLVRVNRALILWLGISG